MLTIRKWLRRKSNQWMERNIPCSNKITLNRRNIFIVPTGNGVMFIVATLVIFLAAINYEISLAFGLTYLMISIFIVTMLHTFKNLNRIQLTMLPNPPVFCGEDASFQILLGRDVAAIYESLELGFTGSTSIRANLVEHDQEKVAVFTRVTRRGEFKAPRLTISTTFPLGLFRAWSRVDLNLHCLVYPKPVPVSLDQIRKVSTADGETALTRDGSDDFYGLRTYTPSDSLKQVAWKNVARGQGMLVKQFVDYVDDRVWLDWDMFYGFKTEERLSRLCHCALKLSSTRSTFGLKLPGVQIEPGCGSRHTTRVLETLALFDSHVNDKKLASEAGN